MGLSLIVVCFWVIHLTLIKSNITSHFIRYRSVKRTSFNFPKGYCNVLTELLLISYVSYLKSFSNELESFRRLNYIQRWIFSRLEYMMQVLPDKPGGKNHSNLSVSVFYLTFLITVPFCYRLHLLWFPPNHCASKFWNYLYVNKGAMSCHSHLESD